MNEMLTSLVEDKTAITVPKKGKTNGIFKSIKNEI